MQNVSLQDSLYWQLLRVAINAKHSLMSTSDKYGLSVMQLYTLCLLEADSAISMNSLSSLLHCDASNVTGIVERLFSHKYIKREENPKDRREKIITLTPKGTNLCVKISQDIIGSEPAALHTLSHEQKKQLQILLKLVL